LAFDSQYTFKSIIYSKKCKRIIHNIFVFRSEFCARRLSLSRCLWSLDDGHRTFGHNIIFINFIRIIQDYNIVSSVFNYYWCSCRTGLPKDIDNRSFVSDWSGAFANSHVFIEFSIELFLVYFLFDRDYNIIIVIRRGFPLTGITTTTCCFTTSSTTSVHFSPYTRRPS